MNEHLHGMVPRTALNRASAMADSAKRLTEVTAVVERHVAELRTARGWRGEDADAFFTEFDEFLPQLRAAIATLHSQSQELSGRAYAQLHASHAT